MVRAHLRQAWHAPTPVPPPKPRLDPGDGLHELGPRFLAPAEGAEDDGFLAGLRRVFAKEHCVRLLRFSKEPHLHERAPLILAKGVCGRKP